MTQSSRARALAAVAAGIVMAALVSMPMAGAAVGSKSPPNVGKHSRPHHAGSLRITGATLYTSSSGARFVRVSFRYSCLGTKAKPGYAFVDASVTQGQRTSDLGLYGSNDPNGINFPSDGTVRCTGTSQVGYAFVPDSGFAPGPASVTMHLACGSTDCGVLSDTRTVTIA